MANEALKRELFGPRPAEVQEARTAQMQDRAASFANMPEGRVPVAGMALAGDYAGGVIGGALGFEDPAQQEARLMEEARAEVQASGISLVNNPTEYYKKVYESFSRLGLHNQAQQVRNIMRSENIEDRTLAATETEVAAKALSARAAYKNAIDDSSNREFVVMKDGSIQDLKKGSPELQAALDAGGQPYVQVSAQERLLAAQTQATERAIRLSAAADARASERLEMQADQALLLPAFKVAAEIAIPIAQKASAGRELVSGANEILSRVESGQSELGTATGGRAALTKLVSLLSPSAGEELGNMLLVTPSDIEAQERVAAVMVTALNNSVQADNGSTSRSSTALLKLLRDAGPSVYLTTEGQYVSAWMLKARGLADMEIEKRYADYVSMKEDEVPGNTEGYERYKLRIRNALQYKTKLLAEIRMEDYLPKDLDKKARIAAEMARLEWMPPDTSKMEAGKLYRIPSSGKVLRYKRLGLDGNIVWEELE